MSEGEDGSHHENLQPSISQKVDFFFAKPLNPRSLGPWKLSIGLHCQHAPDTFVVYVAWKIGEAVKETRSNNGASVGSGGAQAPGPRLADLLHF